MSLSYEMRDQNFNVKQRRVFYYVSFGDATFSLRSFNLVFNIESQRRHFLFSTFEPSVRINGNISTL